MRRPIRFRRIKMTITTAGWLYICLTLLIGSAAVNSANNLLYLITAGLLALMSLSGTVAYAALRRLEIEVGLPREWFAGEQMPLRVAVINNRKWLPTFLLALVNGEHRLLLAEVPAGSQREGVLRWTLPVRGRHQLTDLTITSAFPFGFFRRGGILPLPGEIIVYPAPDFAGAESARVELGGRAGLGSQQRGVGGDFRGLRDYAAGDPPARINWKTYARLGTVAVTEFEEDAAAPLTLTLDSVPGPSIEQRLSQLTALVLEAHRAGRPVGLQLPSDTSDPGTGSALRERQLRALALFPA